MIEISDILEAKRHTEGLKAVIFDLDDTLYSEKEYVKSGYQKVAKVLPQISNVEEKLWELFESKKPAIDELLAQEKIQSEKIKQECLLAYRQQVPEIHLYEGVMEMLIELRGKGLKLGIITDGRPEGQRAKIQALGLESFVDHIIITDELGGPVFRKPNMTAFQIMKEKMNVLYDEMCYIGDNIKKDFIAPEKLGIRSIWFKNTDGLYVI